MYSKFFGGMRLWDRIMVPVALVCVLECVFLVAYIIVNPSAGLAVAALTLATFWTALVMLRGLQLFIRSYEARLTVAREGEPTYLYELFTGMVENDDFLYHLQAIVDNPRNAELKYQFLGHYKGLVSITRRFLKLGKPQSAYLVITTLREIFAKAEGKHKTKSQLDPAWGSLSEELLGMLPAMKERRILVTD